MSKTYLEYEQTAVQGRYTVAIKYMFSDMEHRHMLDRGGPVEFDLGGTINETVPGYGAVTFTLPENIKYLPDDFPLNYAVSAEDVSNDDALAQAMVVAWRMNALTVIEAAMQARWASVGEVDFETEVDVEIVTV